MDAIGRQATVDALKRIAESGSDLTRPMSIDFFVAVPSNGAGQQVAQAAIRQGFATSVECDDETQEWTCYCTKNLVPVLEDVIAVEELLGAIAKPVGGKADGFGSFGNAN
jgi:hypothetical protein